MRWFLSITLVASLALPAPAANEHDTHAAQTVVADVEHLVHEAEHAVEHASHESGHDRGLMDLHPNESLYTVVIFLLFFGVLSFVVWPKILKSLQAREEKQRNDLKTAENAAKEASATLAEYKQQLAEARKEAQAIVEQSRKDAQAVAAQVSAEAAAKAKQTTQRAEADIAAAREQAIAAIYEQAAGLSTQIAGQILKREIDPAAHQALVNESLAQLSAKRN